MKPKKSWPRASGTFDNCETPPYALDAILEYIPKSWSVWESACGSGLLADSLKEWGFFTIRTDIMYGTDFFKTSEGCGDVQITNCPYGPKYQWLEHSFELGTPFALLMPAEAAFTKVFWDIVGQPRRGIHIRAIIPRINFKMPELGWYGSGAQFPTAWFCHRIPDLPHGEISHHTLDQKKMKAYHKKMLAQQLSESPLAPNGMAWEDYAKSLRKSR